MELEFKGSIWQWRGPAPYYFVTVPEAESDELRASASIFSLGWGGIRVAARISDTEWETSLMSKDGGYVLSLRDAVRSAEGLADNDTVTVRLVPIKPSTNSQQSPQSPRPRATQTRATDDARMRLRPEIDNDRLAITPANEASWEDLQAVFGERGDRSRCWCQRFKMLPKESWFSIGEQELAARFRGQTGCDQLQSVTTTGLVAYLDGEPVGWCAVEPRPAYGRLLRNNRVPWDGRAENKTDPSVWAVTCFITRTGFRRIGVSRALARAAVDFARQRGARVLEGYPDLVEPGSHLGTRSIFADAGFDEVSRPTNRRVIMRIAL